MNILYRWLLKLFPDRNNPGKIPVVEQEPEGPNVFGYNKFKIRRQDIEKKKKLIELAKKRKADKATGINPWLN